MSVQPTSAREGDSAAMSHSLRPISFNDPAVSMERTADGVVYLRPLRPLPDYPRRITDRLHHWATTAPDRVFMAEREGGRGWRQITYAEVLTSSRHIGSALLKRGLSADRPVVILSGNSSIMRCSPSARSTQESRSARCRRPIRWFQKTSASCRM